MNQLLPESRRAQLLEQLRQHGTLRATELAELLGVAAITIRRDINQLAQQGLLRRVHGGAALAPMLPTDATATPAEGAAGFKLGMLVPSLEYYWPEIIAGAKRQAAQEGVQLLLRGTSYDSSNDRAQVEHLLADGVDALLLAPNTEQVATGELLAWLHQEKVPLVLVEREAETPDGFPIESVNTDHLTGAAAAVRHLVALGHRKIGYVTGKDSPHAEQIRQGWRQAVEKLGLGSQPVCRQLTQLAGFEQAAEIADIIEECIASGTTALLVHADSQAIAIAQHCQQRGIDIPGQLSLIAYDDEVAGLFSPPLTAVRPPRVSIGRIAVSLLLERLREPTRPAVKVVATPKLSLRDSVAAPDAV